ncbi:hypothetical protein RJT34_21859 [Clitoria ternatea]|uniref:PROP1-like PPR domain-containing protein n=1 Tax=Clitoria ternatea TaxID=43366 RepID=A0AAN9IV03_CLITE
MAEISSTSLYSSSRQRRVLTRVQQLPSFTASRLRYQTMWALRRASIPLRNRGFNLRASCVKLARTTSVEQHSAIPESLGVTNDGNLLPNVCYHSGFTSLNFTVSRRELSSSSINENDDLEDGFSELEEPSADGNENASLSSSEESDSDSDSEDVDEPFNEINEQAQNKGRHGRVESELAQEIMNAPGLSIYLVLDKWVDEGKELNRQEISLAMFILRQCKMYGRALQLSEWLESKKQLDFIERDYASRVDLIAKVRGLQKAEVYIESVPKSSRGEIIYRTLLANCVNQNDIKKAEEIFNKMKDLGFSVSVFACNQLLYLYKRQDKKKIADVLLLMENENIKPSPRTYEILIDVKGQSRDIDGMDQIVERMKAGGIEPDIHVQAVLVRHYIAAELQDKAETLLKEMEGEDLNQNRWMYRILLPLYANLGKVDDVRRIWKVCETKARLQDCLAAIEAWGKLNKVDEAEEVFEQMLKRWKLSSKTGSALLKVYADNKMLMKGKDLIRRMADSGCRIGPWTWDAIVKLYVQAGEVEKADLILHKATQQSPMKPIFSTYLTILEQYAKRGDVHNSEKIFLRMKQADFSSRGKMYQVLMQAYINAKLPAYGIRDRMKADNIFPNRNLLNQLVLVDGFRKNPISELFD